MSRAERLQNPNHIVTIAMAAQPTGRILVIDDSEHNRYLLAHQLHRRGYAVVTAVDGRQGLEFAQQQPFDVILLDLMMPEMDGFTVLDQLKRDPRMRHIPVIVISAIDAIDDVVRCIEAGAEDYLTKPINTTLLHARVNACLARKRLLDQEQAYLMAIRYELELGRRMQADFLLERLPHIAGWEIAATFVPAREVAGDFYDAFILPDQRLVCLLGDVCDKGVGAALFMALTRSLLRAFAEQSALNGDDPLHTVAMTNEYIARHHHASRIFSTIFCVIIDPASGTMRYVHAGHPAPVVLHADSSVEMLLSTGPAAGWITNAHFSTETTTLVIGDTLFAYTDGVTEARAPNGALFSEDRLLATLDPSLGGSNHRLAAVQQAVMAYTGRQQPEDDLTMLVVRRRSAA
ncbi:PP2C family protein-serine/threonine phosphatase [Chloroflexus sp.]|uniref:PP2C family protein-serine/threonine phosphatase n=1 Tax=Chloroflexus sp. TaxID=1904827 RepID=UPI002ACD56FA|nr:SpoIIE family protein phosphatase [Chloroflexus sp.]